MNSLPTIRSSAIFARLRAELKLKLFLAVGLNLWMFVPYHFLQQHHLFPARAMPESFCDRLIPFSDQAVWIYLSIYLLMPVGPFLMRDRGEIGRYAFGVALIGALADIVFIFWPTWCPRPPAAGVNALYQMLIGIDNPFHAFPSLHAAFAIFSALCAQRVLREMGSKILWRSGIWVWAGLILFATLATKQHMVADVVAGSILALGIYIFVFTQADYSHSKTKIDAPLSPPTQTQTNSTAL